MSVGLAILGQVLPGSDFSIGIISRVLIVISKYACRESKLPESNIKIYFFSLLCPHEISTNPKLNLGFHVNKSLTPLGGFVQSIGEIFY